MISSMTNSKSSVHTRRRGIRRASRSSRQRKLKKTFSLSPESVDFLKRLAKAYHSDSEALDALIREKESQAKKERIDAAIMHYYDSMSEEEREENRAWGEFAESQFPTE